MSDNHDLLNDNDMCSFSGHEAEDMCFNCSDHTCGDGCLTFQGNGRQQKSEGGLLSGGYGFI